jgi:YVTN family beta-propeller protein
MGVVRPRSPRPRRVALPATWVAGLAVIAFGIAACDSDTNGEPPTRADAPVQHLSVKGVELYPIPDEVAAACREAGTDARAPILCPTHLPRPSTEYGYTSLVPSPFVVQELQVRGRGGAYGVDITYSGPTERPSADRPERFLHFDVQARRKGWNVSDRLPPGVRPTRLGGRRGLLAPATSRDYAVEPFWGNHVRFFWREGETRYAATLHNFGPGTRALLDALVARLQPVEDLRPAFRPLGTGVERIRLPIVLPASVAVSDAAVWVAGGRALIGLDPDSRQIVVDDARLRAFPAYLAAKSTVWVAHPASFYYKGDRFRYRDDGLERFDPKGGRFAQSVPARRDSSGVALGEGSVWVTDLGGSPRARDYEGGTVQRVDPKAGRVVAEASVGRAPAGVAVGEGGVWVTNNLDDTVSRIDPQTMKARGAISVGDSPTGIAAGLGGVWVANTGSNTVTRIDPDGDEPTRTIAVGDGPRGVALGEGSVWVANYLDDTVSRIDPAAMEVTETIRVGSGPVGIAVGHGAVWVATAHDGALFRIDP